MLYHFTVYGKFRDLMTKIIMIIFTITEFCVFPVPSYQFIFDPEFHIFVIERIDFYFPCVVPDSQIASVRKIFIVLEKN